MEKYITCRYCQKPNRLACMFMKINPYKFLMCNFCQTNVKAGKKLVGTKWVGYRYSQTPEWRKEYKLKKGKGNIKKSKRLYSPLNKEQREKVNLIINNNAWIEDYLPD